MDERCAAIAKRVEELVAPYAAERGIELVEITYRREQGGMVLRLLADTAQGIRMDECEELNTFLSETLDREDLIAEHYLIEVSSPGLDRPLKTDRDFRRTIGKAIEVTTFGLIDGKRSHDGVLVSADADAIVIGQDAAERTIPRKQIAKACRKIDFGAL